MILGTLIMTSTKTHQDFNITLKGILLGRAKFLGVLIDECLLWKKNTSGTDVFQEQFQGISWQVAKKIVSSSSRFIHL